MRKSCAATHTPPTRFPPFFHVKLITKNRVAVAVRRALNFCKTAETPPQPRSLCRKQQDGSPTRRMQCGQGIVFNVKSDEKPEK